MDLIINFTLMVTYKTDRVIGQASEDNSITVSYFSRERCRLSPLCLQLLKFPGASGGTHVHQSSWWVNRAWKYNKITKKPSGSMIKKIKHPRWWHFCPSRAMWKRSVLNCIECELHGLANYILLESIPFHDCFNTLKYTFEKCTLIMSNHLLSIML